MINLIVEETTEVDINKLKNKKSVTKRRNLSPNAAEQNVFSNLFSKSSYDNYGNHKPYGSSENTVSNRVSNTVSSGTNTVSNSSSSAQ